MQCSAFQHRLDELLDRRESPTSDRLLNAHAQRCADCRETLLTTDRLLMAVGQLSTETGAPSVAAAEKKASLCWRTDWRMGLVAATLLVAAATWSSFTNHELPQESSPAVLVHSPAVVSSAEPSGAFVYQPIVGLSLLSRADFSGLDTADVPFAGHVPPLETDWLRKMANDIEPVQQSMSNTLDLLRRSLLRQSRTSTVAING